MMFELIKSLFFNLLSSLITIENVKRILCGVVGYIYIYTKFKFKATYMPSYLYDYNKDLINENAYNEILNNYIFSVFIITFIEGLFIVILLLHVVMGISVSIEINSGGGIII